MLLEVPESFGRDIAAIINQTLEPIDHRLMQLECRRPERGEKGDQGEKGEPGEAGPRGSDANFAPYLAPAIERIQALESRPSPERGEKGDPGERGEPGTPADSAIVEEVRSLIAIVGSLRIKIAELESRPIAEKGDRGDCGEAGQKGDPGERGDKGEPGFSGRDGLPGQPGRDGKDGSDGLDGKNGGDGRDGKDGANGLSFDDVKFEMSEDGRTIIERYYRDAVVINEFRRPSGEGIYCGPWKPDGEYYFGDSVSQGGSGWKAISKTPKGKPGDGSGDWQLFVKKGRDGKDGERGPQGAAGPSGRDGKDLTQLGNDGSKW